MERQKKEWETPKLICLYRGRAEEAVLQDCKTTLSLYPAGGNKTCSNPNCVELIATT